MTHSPVYNTRVIPTLISIHKSLEADGYQIRYVDDGFLWEGNSMLDTDTVDTVLDNIKKQPIVTEEGNVFVMHLEGSCLYFHGRR